MDFSKPIEIAKDIFWVGYVIPNDPFQCHVYLIKNGKESVLIDPGSMITFPITLQKITSIMPLDDIKYIILHHQDPDIVGCVSTLETLMPRNDKVFITHWRTETLLKHYQWKTPFWLIDDHDWKLTLSSGRELEFVFTPYAHFAGAFCTFDKETKTLFSSDIFGGLTDEFSLFAKDEGYFESLKLFHIHYMPSKIILNHALLQIEKKNPHLIAPQHGSIITQHLIGPIIEKMKDLDCGLYLLDEFESNIYLLNKADELLKKFFEDIISLSSFELILRNLFDYVKKEIPNLKKILVCQTDGKKENLAFKINSSRIESMINIKITCDQKNSFKKELVHDAKKIGYIQFFFSTFKPEEGKLITMFLNKILMPFAISFKKEIDFETMEKKALIDPLTKLYNRNLMESFLQDYIQIAYKTNAPLCIAMLDIDFFKKINDEHGHQMGDSLLQKLAEVLRKSMRNTDILIRYGGEEILIIMPNTSSQNAKEKMEDIRQKIENEIFCGKAKINVTVSIGVYQYNNETIEKFLKEADDRLYKAKKTGRNKVIF